MKKILLILIGITFLFELSAQQKFHLIYIRFDFSMNIDLIKEQIRSVMAESGNDNYVLFYSNDNIVMDASSWDEVEMYGSINEFQSAYSIDQTSEIDTISSLIERYMGLYLNGDQLRSEKYTSLVFDFFVGEYFETNDYFNGIVAPVILANSLENFNYDVKVYPCGYKLNKDNIRLKTEYNLLDLEKKIVINN